MHYLNFLSQTKFVLRLLLCEICKKRGDKRNKNKTINCKREDIYEKEN